LVAKPDFEAEKPSWPEATTRSTAAATMAATTWVMT
jgi:hypothetical protein